MKDQDYKDWLEDMDFNPEQVEFIFKQREIYLALKEEDFFDNDVYEKDMWFIMNRRGLFEKNKENKSDICSWEVSHTQMYITEI